MENQNVMKTKIAVLTSMAALALFFTTSARAEDKEVTVTGETKCAKCILKKAEKCQNVIEAKGDDGKKVTYWLAKNDVSDNFKEDVCKDAKKVTATGTVKEEDGKKVLTATKIALAKNDK